MSETTFKQKLENFWYYYKFHTFVALFLAAVLVFGTVQFFTRKIPDYKVIMYLNEYESVRLADAVESAFEKYAAELAGGAKKIVSVSNCSFREEKEHPGDVQFEKNQRTILQGEIWEKKAFIFITDEYRYNELENSSVLKGVLDEKNKKVPIKDTPFEKLILDILPKDTVLPEMYLSMRKNPGTSDKTIDVVYNKSLELFNSITAKQ